MNNTFPCFALLEDTYKSDHFIIDLLKTGLLATIHIGYLICDKVCNFSKAAMAYDYGTDNNETGSPSCHGRGRLAEFEVTN